MVTGDHFLLARWLLKQGQSKLPRRFAAGLLTGSVLPDCNPFTYFRGIRGGQGLYGHHAEITRGKICALLAGSEKPGKAGFLRGLRLGTALHYLADAFTYPHHQYYQGSLADHVSYEKSLHRTFRDHLASGGRTQWTKISDFDIYFDDMLRLYRQCRKSERGDCRFITLMCGMAFETALGQPKTKEVVLDEDPDHIRSVPAIR